jgi:hypothetical protein
MENFVQFINVVNRNVKASSKVTNLVEEIFLHHNKSIALQKEVQTAGNNLDRINATQIV